MSAVADEIWDILREVSESHKEFKEAQKEARIETDRIIKELQAGQKELQAGQKELQALQKETSREIREVSKSVGRLTNRLGEFVEEAVRPSAVRLFRERGIDIHEVQQNVTAKRDGEALEIDLLVVNNEDVVVIECKSNLSIDDVNEQLERLEKVKRLLPRYKDCRILGAVAGMVIPDNVATYAIRKGLYVIGQNGEHLELRNDRSFAAKVW
ncbi:MAG: DUF3782 domain-containing protein [Methylococcaceae bacterium]